MTSTLDIILHFTIIFDGVVLTVIMFVCILSIYVMLFTIKKKELYHIETINLKNYFFFVRF